MNWIFEAYSNVYKVAMMRKTGHSAFFASIQERPRRSSHRRLSRQG